MNTSNYTIRTLEREDLDQMYSTFLEAFSDYQINFNLSKEQFDRRFLQKLNINFDLSVGAFFEGKLVGFVFHAVNQYRSETMLYNGGTGVIPKHRGHGLVAKMYQLIKSSMIENRIERSVLEVITKNEKAIKAYEKVGFEALRVFKCFKLTKKLTERLNPSILINKKEKPVFNDYLNLVDYEPSFIDTFPQLENNPNELVLEAYTDNQLAGFIVFQPLLGRISQLGVDKKLRKQGIGYSLIKETQELSNNRQLTLLNVDEEEFDMINFLTNRGFENQIDQYEMFLKTSE